MKTLLMTFLLCLALSLVNCIEESDSAAFVDLSTRVKYVNKDGQNLFNQTLEGSIDFTKILIYYETLDHGYSASGPSGGQIEIFGAGEDRHLQILVFDMNGEPLKVPPSHFTLTSYIKLSYTDFDTVQAFVNRQRGYTVIDSLRYNGKLIEPWYSGDVKLVTVIK